MKKNGGFITILLALVILAAAIIFIMYAWQNYSSAGFLSSSSTNTGSNFSGAGSLLDFGSNNSVPSSSSGSSNNSQNSVPSNKSSYSGSVYLSSGNAENEYQPESEYIQIQNQGNSSVNITGWTLENAYGNRPLQTTGNQAVTVSSEKVLIPQGTNFLDPSGNFVKSSIILKPEDTAYVLTGGPFISYPFKITTSFRENICDGYLNNTYPFSPQMSNNCPSPQNEPGIGSITDVCYNYVRYLPTCYDPEVKDKNNLTNNFQQNCINYIDAHFNYAACVANHGDDADFNQPNWYVFLGLNHELWHAPDDSIKLFDANGKLVDEIDY